MKELFSARGAGPGTGGGPWVPAVPEARLGQPEAVGGWGGWQGWHWKGFGVPSTAVVIL